MPSQTLTERPRYELRARRESVVAVCPIVGGKSLKGPSDKMLAELDGDRAPCSLDDARDEFEVEFVSGLTAPLQGGAPMSTDGNVRVEVPANNVNQLVTADGQYYVDRGGNSWYQSTAEITTILTANKSGAYRISDVGSARCAPF